VFNAVTGNGDDHDANHGLVLDRPEYGYRLAPLFDPVAATDLQAKDLAMAFGEDGRHISRRNLLSRPGQFGLDRERAEDLLKRIGTTVAQGWRETLRTLGADPRQVDRLSSWFAFAEELTGTVSDAGKPRDSK
jgi:hypothetical protein